MNRPLLELNPVALKELRQLVRSKIVLWGLVLFPALQFVAGLCAIASQVSDKSPAELAFGKGCGTPPFGVYTVILCIAAVFGIPVFTAVKTALDASRERMSLTFITALTPADIVGGKMTAAAVLMLIAAAVSTPFFALAYLLRGVPLTAVLLAPATVFAGGMLHLAVLMPLACQPVSTVRRVIMIVIVALVLLLFGGPIFLMIEASHHGGFAVPGDAPSAWTLALAGLFLYACMLALSRAKAAELLSAPCTDCQRSLRRLELGALALSLPFLAEPKLVDLWSCGFLALAALDGYQAAFRASGLPRPVIGRAPAVFWKRLLAFPFATGKGPSLAASWLIALTAICALLVNSHAPRHPGPVLAFLILTGFALIVGGIAQLCRAGEKTRRMLSTLTFVWLLAANLLSLLFIAVGAITKETAEALPGCIHGLFEPAPQALAFASGNSIALTLAAAAPLVSLAIIVADFRKFRQP